MKQKCPLCRGYGQVTIKCPVCKGAREIEGRKGGPSSEGVSIKENVQVAMQTVKREK